MSGEVSAVVAAALDRVISDNGWLSASRAGSLRASLSDVLGSESEEHRAEVDALVVSAEEGVPARLRTVGRAAAQGLVPELTQKLVDWGMTASLAASVVDTWASLVPEVTRSVPALDTNATVISERKGPLPPPVAPAPAAESPPAAQPVPAETSLPPSSDLSPSPAGGSRSSVWLAGAVAVAVVIAAAAWVGLRQRSHHDEPLVAMLTSAVGPAHGLVPTKTCKATADQATCTQSSSAISRLDLRTYPDQTALYRAYLADVEQLRGTSELNKGECNNQVRSGEVSWNHDFQHPNTYSIADHLSGDLMKDGSAEGRLACKISGSFMTIIWTDDCGSMLGQIEGPVMNLFDTWRALHHNIVPPGCTPTMDMNSDRSLRRRGR